MSMVVKLLKTSMASRPLSTNCVMFGGLAGLAEFSQQALTNYKVGLIDKLCSIENRSCNGMAFKAWQLVAQ